MMVNTREISIIPLTIVMVALLLWIAHRQVPVAPIPTTPDFSAIRDVKTKKTTFFDYMLPLVRQSNKEISQERSQFLEIRQQLGNKLPLTENQNVAIVKLAKKYRVTGDNPQSKQAMTLLGRRIDTIPAALALAQAANESAWGTARFAVNGNNYFGLWCWSSNCGLVPRERTEGETHEVTRFNAPVDSVKNYMLTLNSHPAYKKLRELRSQARGSNISPTGTLLADGLLSYSERGEAYIEELRAMIRVNNLSQFDPINLASTP